MHTAAYIRMFRFVEDNICKLEPTKFMSDYEGALRKAIRHVYPACELSGCLFHLTQAARKKASQIPGFFGAVTRDEKLNQLYHKFMALPLLPAGCIVEAFNALQEEANRYPGPVTTFVTYFQRQWIVRVSYKKKEHIMTI